jgi:hypothetical protein
MMQSVTASDESTKEAFVIGWQVCKHKYKYTDEDLRKAMDFISDFKDYRVDDGTLIKTYGFSCANLTPDSAIDRFIQSLDQPKLPIAFEREVVKVEDMTSVYKDWYKIGEPKIFINSEGRTQWVGTYHY